MRRNSSFADYFEGDLSQNLLSRRHFQLLSKEERTERTPDEAASDKQIINGQLADLIKSESHRCANTATSDGKLGKLSEVNICSRKYFYHCTSMLIGPQRALVFHKVQQNNNKRNVAEKSKAKEDNIFAK